MKLKEDDLVMCTVKKIENTTVFVEIEGNGEGSIIMSEIAAGRIRNLRDYVSPNKKIVCKVLSIINGYPQLSLRRVTGKEKEEIMEKYKKEKTLINILKTIKENPEPILKKIMEKYELSEFLDEVKSNPSLIEKFLTKEETEKFKYLISEKQEKEKVVKKKIILSSQSESGITEIKETLNVGGVEIHYLGSSAFSIAARAKDFKTANQKITNALSEIEKRAKEKKLFLEIKEK